MSRVKACRVCFAGIGCKLLLSSLIAIGWVAAKGLTLQGAVFYVATNGSDSANGALQTPFRSIQHAITLARAGDQVLVRGGEYDEGEVWIRGIFGQGGSPGQFLTIAAYPGEAPVLSNGARPFIVDADFVRVEGLHFRNGKSIGIWGNDRNTTQIVNNTFPGSGYSYDAISTSGHNVLLEGNVCDIQGNTVGTQGHCYYIHHGTNIVVRGNVARGMTGYGIHVFDQRRSEDPLTFERLIKDVVIENNITYESEQRAGIIVAAYGHARLENVIIRNNLAFNHGGAGIVVRSDANNVQVVHNTVFNNADAALEISGTDSITNLLVANNILDTGQHVTEWQIDKSPVNAPGLQVRNNVYDPQGLRLNRVVDTSPVVGPSDFLRPDQRDFRLRPGSAAIDAGALLPNVLVDIRGVTRPRGAGWDAGAYEFVPLLGDLTADGYVDGADTAVMFRQWQTGGTADLTGDGTVDGADLARLYSDWTGDAFLSLPVPEPAMPWWLGSGLLPSVAWLSNRSRSRKHRRQSSFWGELDSLGKITKMAKFPIAP